MTPTRAHSLDYPVPPGGLAGGARRPHAAAVILPARTDTVDRYLETIYCIASEGEAVRPSRIADWQAVSAPTVSIALQRLERDGWIAIGRDRSVTLTAAGDAAAAAIVRRHRIAECWLTDMLHFDWASAHTEADRLAPALSDDVLARLDAALGEPVTCPHGHPIPGRTAPYGSLIPLADLEPGTPALVRRISEIIEHEALQVLHDLAEHGVSIGVAVTVADDDGAAGVAVRVVGAAGAPLTVSTATARLIWVEAAAQPGGLAR